MKTPSNRKPGFTLIELLVVIAIIAILAGILVPTVSSAIDKARKVESKSVTTSLVAAIQQFYNDYGKLPVPAGDQGSPSDLEYGTNTSQQILIILTATAVAPNVGHVLNPRKKVYFDAKNTENDGTLKDPWGKQYLIVMDTDYTGKTEYDYPGAGKDEVTSVAVVASAGKDGEFGDPHTEDDVVSYEVTTN